MTSREKGLFIAIAALCYAVGDLIGLGIFIVFMAIGELIG